MKPSHVYLLVVITGAVNGFRPNEQYEYAYEGQITTGISGLKNQVAGTGLKCGVTVQVFKNATLLVKFTAVKVGDFNGEVASDGRTSINITYKNIEDEGRLLEEPFTVYMKDKKHVMVVPEAEATWITNIRKSIVQYFLVDPLRRNFISNEGLRTYFLNVKKLQSYALKEESILGDCSTTYSFQPFKSRSEEAGVGNIRENDWEVFLSNKTWRVIRSTNLDECSDKVVLQKSSLGSFPDAGKAFESPLQSRLSNSALILDYRNGFFILRRVDALGAVISNLYGVENNNKIHTKINQTLQLISSGEVKESFGRASSKRVVETLSFEVLSPFESPKDNQKPWIRFQNKSDTMIPFSMETIGLGKTLSSDESDAMKFKLLHLLDEVSSTLSSIPAIPLTINPSTVKNHVLEKLVTMAKIMENLPEDRVERIFEMIFIHTRRKTTKLTMQQNLLIDVSCASGSAASLNQILKLMKNGRISDEKSVTIFATLTNHISSPFALAKITDYLKHLSAQEKPFLVSVAVINFANTVRRLCLQEDALPKEVFGKFACNNDALKKYVDFVFPGVLWTKEPWLKMIWLEATIRIGPPFSTIMLMGILTDPDFSDPMLKLSIVRGLRRHRNTLPEYQRNEFRDFFNEVIENEAEDIRVRQGAMITVLSWGPDSAWWHRMARKTYQEKSPEMAAFIYFTMRDMASLTSPELQTQATLARSALVFCKKFSPNYRYPVQYFSDVVLPLEQLELREGVMWLPDALKELIAYVSSSLGGKIEKIFDLRWEESKKGAFPEVPLRPGERGNFGTLVFKLWKNIEEFLPVNYFTISHSIGVGGNKFLRSLHQDGKKIQVTKFFNALSRDVLLPTEIGLPIVVKMSVPVLIMNEGKAKIAEPDMADITFQKLWKSLNVDIPYKLNSRISFKTISKVDVLVPWSGLVASSGIDNAKDINLPTEGHLLQNVDEMGTHNFSVAATPLFEEKFPVLYAHNLPYTSLSYLWPLNEDVDAKSFKLIYLKDDQAPVFEENFTLKRSLDMKLEVFWKADHRSRFSRGDLLDYIKCPQTMLGMLLSPTQKLSQTYVTIDPENSVNKNFTVAMSLAILHSGGASANDALLEKEKDVTTSPSKMRLGYSLPKKLGRSIKTTSVSLLADLLSFGWNYHHEALEATAVVAHVNGIEKDITYALAYKSGISDHYGVGDLKMYCFVIDMESYRIENIHALIDLLKSRRTLRQFDIGYFSESPDCVGGEPSRQFQAVMTVSEERQKRLIQELNQTCEAGGDPLDPTMGFETDAIYDRGRLVSYGKQRDISENEEKTIYFMYDIFKNIFEPQIQTQYLATPHHGNNISMAFERGIESAGWDIEVKLPSGRVTLSDVRVPRFMDQIVYPGGFNPPLVPLVNTPQFYLLAPPKPQIGTCKISADKFVPFDNQSFGWHVSNCYTMASKPITSTVGNPQWLIMVRRRDSDQHQIEIRLEIGNDNIIDINRDGVKLNGHSIRFIEDYIRIYGDKGKPFCTIFKKKNSFHTIISTGVKFLVTKNEVEIILDSRFSKKIHGLCGQFTKTKAYLGPKGCLYSDGLMTLFPYAWTLPRGHLCDLDDFYRHYVEVSGYQKTCKKTGL